MKEIKLRNECECIREIKLKQAGLNVCSDDTLKVLKLFSKMLISNFKQKNIRNVLTKKL